MNYDFDVAVFDMDGTLLDTMLYWRYTSLEFLLAHGLPVRPDDLLKMQTTSSRKHLFDIAAREGIDIGAKAEVVAELEEYMNRHYLYDCRLKDKHVPAFLEKLKQKGIRMCVATGSRREHARNGLGHVGILDYFEFVTDNYEAGTGVTKAEPEYFTALAERLGTTPDRCVVFEDAVYAMKSAKAAGFRVLAIEDITAEPFWDEIHALADWHIKSYSELL